MDLHHNRKEHNLIIAFIIIMIIIFCVNFNQFVKFFHHNADQPKTNNYNDSEAIKNTGVDNKKEQEYSIKIEKLGIDAPIVIDVDGGNEEEYNKSLESGVAHMRGTAKPGEDGNIVIFGHSSKSPKYQGNYSEIFVSLNDLETGDEIKIIGNKGGELVYKVEEKNIVEPSNVEVLSQDNKNRLTLLTCWPIGSNEKRLIIVASKINS